MNSVAASNGSAGLLDAMPAPTELPAPKLPMAGPPGSDPATAPLKRSLDILCIDDDEQILEIMQACLQHFGHRVKVASGGRSGIETFSIGTLKSEPYDAVITDLNMPDVDGYEVTRQIKAESPGTPVILISGLGPGMDKSTLSSAPVDAVVGKPPDMQRLNDLLLRITA